MWWENSILLAIVSFTIIAVMLLIFSAVPTFNLSPGAEKSIQMIITAIGAFVTGWGAKSVKDAVTSTSTITKEESSNAPKEG